MILLREYLLLVLFHSAEELLALLAKRTLYWRVNHTYRLLVPLAHRIPQGHVTAARRFLFMVRSPYTGARACATLTKSQHLRLRLRAPRTRLPIVHDLLRLAPADQLPYVGILHALLASSAFSCLPPFVVATIGRRRRIGHACLPAPAAAAIGLDFRTVGLLAVHHVCWFIRHC